MFDIFRKKTYLRDHLEGLYDIHSHLLWGVDDGCPTAEHTSDVVAALGELGIRGACLTPHIIYGLHGSRGEAELRARMAEMPDLGEFETLPGAEYYLDEKFMDHVEGEEPLLTLGDEWLLVEYGLRSPRVTHLNELFEVSVSGLNPIIAHPERYAFVSERKDRGELQLLTSRNYALQLNVLSLAGYYGERVRSVAERLLLEGAYTFVGTDVHSRVHVRALREAVISPKMVPHLRTLVENNRHLIWKK
ncbi:MAG: hypothetical protein J6V28_02965 [Tidjanibacter sp.]|nr:hypothetical protein [Tidjanibacter sp.]